MPLDDPTGCPVIGHDERSHNGGWGRAPELPRQHSTQPRLDVEPMQSVLQIPEPAFHFDDQ